MSNSETPSNHTPDQEEQTKPYPLPVNAHTHYMTPPVPPHTTALHNTYLPYTMMMLTPDPVPAFPPPDLLAAPMHVPPAPSHPPLHTHTQQGASTTTNTTATAAAFAHPPPRLRSRRKSNFVIDMGHAGYESEMPCYTSEPALLAAAAPPPPPPPPPSSVLHAYTSLPVLPPTHPPPGTSPHTAFHSYLPAPGFPTALGLQAAPHMASPHTLPAALSIHLLPVVATPLSPYRTAPTAAAPTPATVIPASAHHPHVAGHAPFPSPTHAAGATHTTPTAVQQPSEPAAAPVGTPIQAPRRGSKHVPAHASPGTAHAAPDTPSAAHASAPAHHHHFYHYYRPAHPHVGALMDLPRRASLPLATHPFHASAPGTVWAVAPGVSSTAVGAAPGTPQPTHALPPPPPRLPMPMQGDTANVLPAAPASWEPVSPMTLLRHRQRTLPYLRTAGDTLVCQMTLGLSHVYRRCDPHFMYSPHMNARRRVLTKQHQPYLNDGFDNADHDYMLVVNDALAHDYLIEDLLGQGTFGQVVKCRHVKSGQHVAIKVIKNKAAYFYQSMMELNTKFDPHDQRHIIRLKDSFVFRNHLCLVFELLSINLYELIKLNQFRGLQLSLVKRYTQQLLDALCCLNEAKLIHCDLKPENILLRDATGTDVKIIDFGSACLEQQTVYTYIQSRFYRSPEVLLGLPYTNRIDMWSVGCIACELVLGLPLFPGTSEYNQLSRMVETLGVPPGYMLEMSRQGKRFFVRSHGRWTLKPRDVYVRETGQPEAVSKRYFASTQLPELFAHIDNRECFLDFVAGCLQLNPMERWSPHQARRHPFLTGAPFPAPLPAAHPAIHSTPARRASAELHPTLSPNPGPPAATSATVAANTLRKARSQSITQGLAHLVPPPQPPAQDAANVHPTCRELPEFLEL